MAEILVHSTGIYYCTYLVDLSFCLYLHQGIYRDGHSSIEELPTLSVPLFPSRFASQI